ncbi:MFS transporter [Streptomyces sp. sk2.1]|uniref:MFS transporter n=1 Tax=Streptomyces sp. sk2.1 TaxID=2478959 RepID=UPI0011E76E4B|nr:MFS transporter [Streptomyces sp. sk2.1]TXS81372.1 MFS transporter [Streptomyces sp. sk2.1]
MSERAGRGGEPVAVAAAPGRAPAAGAGPGLTGAGLFTLLIGASLPLLDYYIVNVALPSMERDLRTTETMLELVVAGYGVAHAVLLVLCGRLGDRFGRRRLFLWGMAAFGLTSLVCGLATDAWTLVIARVAQGAAASLLLPQVLATIQATTEGARRGRAIGLYGATTGLSMVAGQVLGGVLVAADIGGTGWRAVFLVNVPVVLLGLGTALRTVPETRSDRPHPVDLPGTLLLALALGCLLLPLTEGRAAGWPWWAWTLLVVTGPAAAAFVAVEYRADRAGRVPLLPPSLVGVRSMRRGLAMVPTFSIGFGGFMFCVAVALQTGLDFGPVTAGIALAPMALAFFAASLVGPSLVARFGGRVAAGGAAVQIVGLVLVAVAVRSGWPGLGVLELAPGMAIAGFGQGLVMPVVFRVVLSDVPNAMAGVGSGVMITAQQSMLALGAATLGSLFLGLVPGAGMRDALLTALTVQIVMGVGTLLLGLRLPRRLS